MLMPTQGVVRRDKRSHSNLRPKHKHTKQYLKHYWPYLPLVTLVLVGLWMFRPVLFKTSNKSVLAVSTNVSSSGLLSATNKQRAANKAPALHINDKLNAAAQAKAQDMVNRNYWSHNTPDGSPPWSFIINSGYQYQKAGENLAYGFITSDDAITGWMNSPSHRENLLDKDFVDVGFGTANSPDFNHTGPSTVIVAMYGRSTSETPLLTATGQGSEPLSYTTTEKEASAVKPKAVSKVDLLISSRYTWLTSAISFVVGAALTLFIIKHLVGIKKALKKGEKFAITHPMLDVVLVSIIVIGLVVTRQVGVIL